MHKRPWPLLRWSSAWRALRDNLPFASGWLLLVVWSYILAWGGLLAMLPAPTQAATEAELAYAKGVLEYGNRNYLEALDHLRQAVALLPDNPDAHFYLGLTLTRLGEFQPAIAALAKTLQLDPSKRYVHYHLGLAYYQAAQYQDALEQFEQAVEVDPRKAAAHFYLGSTHYQLKHYRQALPSLQQALRHDARLAPTAQYYRGLSLYALERDRQARQAFEAAAVDPASTLGQNAQRYLAAIRRRAREQQRFQAHGVVSFQYDDNVTIGDDDIISRQADGRMVFAFAGRFLPVRTASWRLGAEYDLFQSLHIDLDEFDLQSHTGKVFGRLKLPRVTFRSAADYTYTTLHNNRYAGALTILPSATLRQTERLFAVASVRYRLSDYRNQFIPPGQEAVRDRDGWSVQAGLTQYVMFDRQRSYVWLGYHFEASRNDGSDWEYDSHRIGLGLHTALGWGISLDMDGSYRRRDYLHANSFAADPLAVLTRADQDKRDDDRFTASVALTRRVGRYLLLSAGYAHTNNLSNLGFFEYDRNIWTVALTGRY